MNKPVLTQKRLKEMLIYDPETGIFTWLASVSNVKAGDIAGSLCKATGYIKIRLDRNEYLAHRLAHFYMEGYFPETEIDHKKGIRCDNRWSQIKPVSRSCNSQNCKLSSNNKSGFPGVSFNKRLKVWQSDVMLNGKTISLGRYDNKLDAALARFTFELNCERWKCNHRGVLVEAIRKEWPLFFCTFCFDPA